MTSPKAFDESKRLCPPGRRPEYAWKVYRFTADIPDHARTWRTLADR